MPLATSMMMVLFGLHETVETSGEIYLRCMSLCLEHMDTIKVSILFFLFSPTYIILVGGELEFPQ